MKTKPSSVYQFKITLEEIKPIIWRRIQVPQRYNFWDLHVAIQDSMGWQDYHLHQFEMVNPKTGEKVHITIQDDDNEDLYDSPVIPDEEAKISSYFTLENKTAKYEYDFGDGWEHKLFLRKSYQQNQVLNILYAQKDSELVHQKIVVVPTDIKSC